MNCSRILLNLGVGYEIVYEIANFILVGHILSSVGHEIKFHYDYQDFCCYSNKGN